MRHFNFANLMMALGIFVWGLSAISISYAQRTVYTTPEGKRMEKVKKEKAKNDILTRTIKDKDTSDLRDLVKQMLLE